MVVAEDDYVSVGVCLLLEAEGKEGQGSRRVGSVPVRSAVSNGAAGGRALRRLHIYTIHV
jgi:hypothetical protein